MQPFKNKSKYSPYPGFYDLRVFNLNPKEFSAAWRMQDFLYRQSLKREYYKCFAPLEWGTAERPCGTVSNDPAAQAEAGRRAPITIN